MSTATATPKPEATEKTKPVNSNPKRSAADLQRLFLSVVTDNDVEEVARKLIDLAVEGNFSAIKLFLSYTLGKPETLQQSVELDAALAKPLPNGASRGNASTHTSALPPLTAADLRAAGGTAPGLSDASDIQLVSNPNARKQDKRKRR